MWCKLAAGVNTRWMYGRRQYAWARWMYARGEAVIQECQVTPDGWVLYELWEHLADGYSGGYAWHGQCYVALIDGDRLVQTYPLTDDEFREFPSMPRNWSIPF